MAFTPRVLLVKRGADDQARCVVFFAEVDALVGFAADTQWVLVWFGEVGSIVRGRPSVRVV